MATPRTTKKSRTGTTRHAVRESSSKFKNMENYRRAHAAERHHLSAAQVRAGLDAVEKKVERATHSAAQLVRCSMQDAVAAGKVVRSSMRQAITAVKRATRRVAKRVSAATQAMRPATKTAKQSARKSSRTPAA